MYSEDNSNPDSPDPNTFIDKLLDEMKNKFNTLDANNIENMPKDITIHNTDDENSIVEDEESSNENNKKRKSIPTPKAKAQRKVRKRSESSEKVGLKRSSLRRGRGFGESILQCAIARKEQSYEASNPQRIKRTSSIESQRSKHITRSQSGEIKEKVKKLPKKRLKTDTLEKIKEETVPRNTNKPNEKLLLKTEESLPKKRRGSRLSSANKTNDSKVDVPEAIVCIDSETKIETSNNYCLCSKFSNIFINPDVVKDGYYCAGVDSFDTKKYSCSQTILSNQKCLMRPSTRIPFLHLCSIHFDRMLKHNCCPYCGIFCTQGQFMRCSNKHLFHEDCHISSKSKHLCPHCDSKTVQKLKMRLSDSVKYKISEP